jgi:integrase
MPYSARKAIIHPRGSGSVGDGEGENVSPGARHGSALARECDARVAAETMPVVRTPSEVRSALAQLKGTTWLMANHLYGSGLRLMESLRLRVKDVVMERCELIVRDANGGTDRVTVLPGSILPALGVHLEKFQLRFNQQLAAGAPGVPLPAALTPKYPNASTKE